MSSSLAANMKATAEAFVMGFNGGWRLDEVMAPRAPECTHETLPTSLGIPKKTNEEWAERFKHVLTLINDSKMTIDDYLAVPAERRAVCRLSMTATTPVGEYDNEYVFFFDFNESGTKLTKIVEFLDATKVAELRDRFAKAGMSDDQQHS